ncbi:MAG: hypothetical protein E7273_13100 [Pseudobutyrivibrio ruminis]|nr:hypothetical protein [Pseudobutyrivibrio ruminis]
MKVIDLTVADGMGAAEVKDLKISNGVVTSLTVQWITFVGRKDSDIIPADLFEKDNTYYECEILEVEGYRHIEESTIANCRKRAVRRCNVIRFPAANNSLDMAV